MQSLPEISLQPKNQMKTIELTQGFVTVVDDEDYENLSKYKWCFGCGGYALRRSGNEIVLMHRQLTGFPNGKFSDHIDGNRLNNRKENLRVVSFAESSWNKGIRKDNTSGHKGVYFDRRDRKFVARLSKNKLVVFHGRYNTLQEAGNAYDEAAKKYYKGFARK